MAPGRPSLGSMTTTPEVRPTECQIIYCYDGSETGRHALLTAANTLGERRAVVVTVWYSSWLAVSAAPYALLPGDTMKRWTKRPPKRGDGRPPGRRADTRSLGSSAGFDRVNMAYGAGLRR